jgi:hypothetical protein
VVLGRWFGVRGRVFIRPTLSFSSGRRLLADLEHKPWAAQDGQPWTASFALEDSRRRSLGPAQLSVAPDVSIELPAPEAGDESDPEVDFGRPAPRADLGLADPRGDRTLDDVRSGSALHQLRAQLRSALAARAAAVADLDVALALRDTALAERDVAFAQRDAARAELKSVLAQRDAALAQRDAAVAERDAALAERRRPRHASTG